MYLQLNQNMEPDYENMNDRVMRLPISEELKQDMVDGINYCKKFSVSALRFLDLWRLRDLTQTSCIS